MKIPRRLTSEALSKKFLTHNQGVDLAMALPDLGTKPGDFLDLIDKQVRSAEKLVQVMRNTQVSFTRYEKNVADIRLISIAEAEGSPAYRPTSEVVRACAAA